MNFDHKAAHCSGSGFLQDSVHATSLQMLKDGAQGPGKGEQILVLSYSWGECLHQDIGEAVCFKKIFFN